MGHVKKNIFDRNLSLSCNQAYKSSSLFEATFFSTLQLFAIVLPIRIIWLGQLRRIPLNVRAMSAKNYSQHGNIFNAV